MKKLKTFIVLTLFMLVLNSCTVGDKIDFVADYQKTIVTLASKDNLSTYLAFDTNQDNISGQTLVVKTRKGDNKIRTYDRTNKDYVTIIEEIDGRYYQYQQSLNESSISLSDYSISNKEDVTDEYEKNRELTDDVNSLGVNLSKIKKEAKSYVAKGKFYDILNENGLLAFYYESTGLDDKYIKNSGMELEIRFGDYFMLINTTLTYENKEYDQKLIVDMDFMIENETDFYRPQWEFYDFRIAYMDAEKVEAFNTYEFRSDAYYEVYFEQGQYGFVYEDAFASGSNGYIIRDLNGEEVFTDLPVSFTEKGFLKGTFIVPKSDWYYFKVWKDSKLSKINYQIDYSNSEVINEGSHNLTLKGTYDIKKYVLNSDKDGIIRIKNTGTIPFNIIGCKGTESPTFIKSYVGVFEYIRLYAGENIFYISSFDASAKEEHDLSFDLDLITINPETEFEKMPKLLMQPPADAAYIGGYNLPAYNFSLEVSKKYEIHFYMKSINQSTCDFEFSVRSYDGLGTVEPLNFDYILTPGKYIVSITGNPAFLSMGCPYYRGQAVE